MDNNMQTMRVLVPSANVAELEKCYKKMQKFVPSITFSVGEEQRMVFSHAQVVDYVVVGYEKKWHKVKEVTITYPLVHDWRLMAYYEDGLTFITDKSKELKFRNPQHGAGYERCDLCKHYVKNSYVVENVKTGEELQVGRECLKKFGLKDYEYISKFTHELYDAACYIFVMCGGDDEEDELRQWRGGSDKSAFAACETMNLLKAAYKYFESHPEWHGGYYSSNGRYTPSASNSKIQEHLANEEYAGTKKWLSAACEYAKQREGSGEFDEEMKRVAASFYATPSDAPYAYFIIKNYADYLRIQTLPTLEVGTQVKVENAEIVKKVRYDDEYWGTTTYEYTMRTAKNMTLVRRGKLPIVHDDKSNKDYTSFYAVVKYVGRNKTAYLDRALKNPKKELKIVEV